MALPHMDERMALFIAAGEVEAARERGDQGAMRYWRERADEAREALRQAIENDRRSA